MLSWGCILSGHAFGDVVNVAEANQAIEQAEISMFLRVYRTGRGGEFSTALLLRPFDCRQSAVRLFWFAVCASSNCEHEASKESALGPTARDMRVSTLSWHDFHER
jgi:hypothetical protein